MTTTTQYRTHTDANGKTYERVPTSALVAGDEVIVPSGNGARVRLIGERFGGPSANPHMNTLTVFAWCSEVLDAGDIPASFLTHCSRHGGAKCWTIQGNDKASWYRLVSK